MGTLMIDITTLSFTLSTMKENLPLDFLYLKKKIEFHRLDPVSFEFLLQSASALPHLHIQDIGHQDH